MRREVCCAVLGAILICLALVSTAVALPEISFKTDKTAQVEGGFSSIELSVEGEVGEKIYPGFLVEADDLQATFWPWNKDGNAYTSYTRPGDTVTWLYMYSADDNDCNASQAFTITLLGGYGYTVGANDVHKIYWQDDDHLTCSREDPPVVIMPHPDAPMPMPEEEEEEEMPMPMPGNDGGNDPMSDPEETPVPVDDPMPMPETPDPMNDPENDPENDGEATPEPMPEEEDEETPMPEMQNEGGGGCGLAPPDPTAGDKAVANIVAVGLAAVFVWAWFFCRRRPK